MKRLGLFALIALLAAPSEVYAQRRGRTPARGRGRPAATATAPAQPAASPNASSPLASELEPPSEPTPDADAVIQVIESVAVTGTADGARSISQLILRGVPPRAAAAGLDALGVLGRPEGAPAVARFLEHRRPSLRRHAVAAAQAIHTPELVRALAGQLADSNEDVRVESAVALGEVGNHEVVDALFAAFDRDLETVSGADAGRLVHESAKAIARLGTPDDITRLMRYLRRAPFRAMADSMRLALNRRDLLEPFKIRIVAAVGDLATREVREFLNSVIADAHGQDSALVRSARTAAERIAE